MKALDPLATSPSVVLYRPEIPHNTGAVGRLCLGTGAALHLIGPLGFSLEDKWIRRVGLDYWNEVNVRCWPDLDALRAGPAQGKRMWFFTTKADLSLWDVNFEPDDFLVFGPESRGLPESLLEANRRHCVTIPMRAQATRSLNLATSAGLALYEALRQQHGAGA